MSVRLQSSGIESRGIATPSRVGAPAAVAAAPAPAVRETEASAPDTSWYAGFAARQSELNREATGTQRALAWMDGLLPRLRELARRLSAPAASAGAAPPALEASLAQLRGYWERRPADSGGTVDAELQLFPAGDARQAFRIRGLDQAALAAPEAETLVFHPRGMGRRARVLVLGEGDAPEERLRRLGAVLAPDGLQVAADDAGGLRFSVQESAWPALRGQLLVQGGGRRFPSGWPSRVVAEPLAGAIDPAQWSVDDAGTRQDAFRQASAALIRAEHARNDMAAHLAATAAQVRAGQPQATPAAMRQAADGFAAGLAGDAGFRRLATAGACLRGMSRQRVGSVLGA
ncbi:hypothetical protein EIM50_04220 [Pseudoxanthomonas sp. SGD-10]|nr:hypothetical protein EIM50_04220 [Pseudoxanthomonas sp. SGD-10]